MVIYFGLVKDDVITWDMSNNIAATRFRLQSTVSRYDFLFDTYLR